MRWRNIFRIREVMFLDPSPLSDIAYARELYRELAKLRITWAGLSTLQVTGDDELLELLQKSGCIGLLLGFETFNQTDLIGLAKGKNKAAGYKEAVAKLHDKRISVLGTFMLGLKGDTKESLRNLPDLIADAGRRQKNNGRLRQLPLSGRIRQRGRGH